MSIEPDSLQSEIILSDTLQSIGKIHLNWMPQPGSHVELNEKTYLVLERHHHYQYRLGGYYLHTISLHVQQSQKLKEKSLIKGCWVIGDATCRYNAHSEIVRCAINPEGPCQDCPYYESSRAAIQ